jgi:hypothetical protein
MITDVPSLIRLIVRLYVPVLNLKKWYAETPGMRH